MTGPEARSPSSNFEFFVGFPDNSVYILPSELEDVFVDGFGFDQAKYKHVEERLSFVTQKYFEHRSWPNENDDLFWEVAFGEEALDDDTRFDDPLYYVVQWGGDEQLMVDAPSTPDMAQIAERWLFLQLLPLILQKKAQELGSSVIVASVETVLKTILSDTESGDDKK